jgi:hypothetical protein
MYHISPVQLTAFDIYVFIANTYIVIRLWQREVYGFKMYPEPAGQQNKHPERPAPSRKLIFVAP